MIDSKDSAHCPPVGRLHELDWLRVFLVLAVFLHHVGMPFNGDDWLIMNMQHSKLLDDIMVYFEQFRLPALFFVAGAGAFLLSSKMSPTVFAVDKLKRLLLPLVVGIVLINPLQLYYAERDSLGSFWQALPQLLSRFDAVHLWFIEYLLVFSMLAIALQYALKTRLGDQLADGLAKLCARRGSILLIGLMIGIARATLKIPFPDDGNALINLSSSLFYFSFFIFGFILVRRAHFWQSLAEHWRTNAFVTLALSSLFYAYYFSDLSDYASLEARWFAWWLLGGVLAWSATITLAGMAQRYLSSSPDWLRGSNKLIYPFYILHQTVIVVVAYYVVQWSHSIAMKLLVLLLLSFVLTALLCRFVIYPFNFMRILFGLRTR